MQPIRRARLEAVILEELSKVVFRELKDPRIAPITFTSCRVTPDGSQATVFITLLGSQLLEEKDSEKKLKSSIDGLSSAAGFLRRHLARALTVRHIPTLLFKEDKGFENTYRVHELLKKISTEPSGQG
jgi:ribosome-binding factor A